MFECKEGEVVDGKYRVLREIGRGGFGAVVCVEENTSNERFALKYCIAEDEENIKRFKREVRIMSSIKHDNVVQILDENLEMNPPYFTMPLASHALMGEIEDLKGDFERVLVIFEEICQGIKIIHSSGFTHRDINPKNILVYDGNKIVVSDLGLAKVNERESTILTVSMVAMGTEAFMAPEQFYRGGTRDADARTDVYQLGKTLYCLLTGEVPYLMDSQRIPGGLWYVIQKATKQNPDDRYQSVGQLLDAILDYKRSTNAEQNPKGTFESLLQIAKDKLVSNEYDRENVQKLIQTIYATSDEPSLFIQLFDEFPEALLMIAPDVLVSEFEPVMEKYVGYIEGNIGGHAFSYAETVARKMDIVIKHSKSPEIIKCAIQSVLCAAISLNRFAAMDSFDEIITSIQDDVAAMAVAEMLRENKTLYKRVYSRVPKLQLHPAIRAVWEVCDDEE
ncbi:serine/threonine-protein kinase [Bacillus cereus]|nr:serine/threonine-protein kinase [Bacillus cereus]